MSKKTYIVRGIDLDHDGTRYPEGSPIELGDNEAAEKRHWLEPVAAAGPQTVADQTKSAKSAKAEDKTSSDGEAGKADDKSQSTGQGEGDKQ